MILSKRIIQLREKNNLSQKELSDSLNINKSVMNRIEQGTRPVREDELLKFSNFFNVSTDYLLGITDDPSPTPTVDYAVAEIKKKLKAEGIDMEDLNDEDIIEMLAKIVKMKKK